MLRVSHESIPCLSTNHLFQGHAPSGPLQRPSKPQKTGIFLGNFLLTCECFGCRWRRRVLGCHKVTKSSTADLNWTWCAALLPGRPQSWVLFSFIVKQAKNSWQTPDYKAVLAKKKAPPFIFVTRYGQVATLLIPPHQTPPLLPHLGP